VDRPAFFCKLHDFEAISSEILGTTRIPDPTYLSRKESEETNADVEVSCVADRPLLRPSHSVCEKSM
jgi:hypothetical protein